MSVQSKIYGMIGITLPYSQKVSPDWSKELRLSEDEELSDYFYDKGLDVNAFKNNHTNTYRIIFDGMNGKYIRCGLVIFESDSEDIREVGYNEIIDYPKEPIRHMIKVLFGIDAKIEEIKTMVWTHYE